MNENSLAAFERITSNLPQSQRRVICALEAFGPQTAEEVAINIGVAWHKISGRFGELRKMGLIMSVGKKLTSSGNQADVWDVNKFMDRGAV
jgi:predicted transcriptional regulator